MKKKWIASGAVALVTVLCALLLAVGGLGCKGPEQSGKWPTQVIVAGPPGIMPQLTALAEVWTKYGPKITASATEVATVAGGTELIRGGEAQFAYSTAAISWAFLNGQKTLNKFDGFRTFMSADPSYYNVIADASKGIKSVEDLKGKKVSIYAWNSSWSTNEVSWGVLKEFGINPGDITEVAANNLTEQMRMIKEGTLDAAIIPGSLGIPTMVEMATVRKVTFVSIPKDRAEKIGKVVAGNFVPVVTPANTYPGQTTDVISMGNYSNIVVRADLPDDFVYELAKTTWGNEAELLKLQPGKFKKFALEMSLGNLAAPYHPGAIKYYKEIGRWTTALEENQKTRLKEIGK